MAARRIEVAHLIGIAAAGTGEVDQQPVALGLTASASSRGSLAATRTHAAEIGNPRAHGAKRVAPTVGGKRPACAADPLRANARPFRGRSRRRCWPPNTSRRSQMRRGRPTQGVDKRGGRPRPWGIATGTGRPHQRASTTKRISRFRCATRRHPRHRGRDDDEAQAALAGSRPDGATIGAAAPRLERLIDRSRCARRLAVHARRLRHPPPPPRRPPAPPATRGGGARDRLPPPSPTPRPLGTRDFFGCTRCSKRWQRASGEKRQGRTGHSDRRVYHLAAGNLRGAASCSPRAGAAPSAATPCRSGSRGDAEMDGTMEAALWLPPVPPEPRRANRGPCNGSIAWQLERQASIDRDPCSRVEPEPLELTSPSRCGPGLAPARRRRWRGERPHGVST